MVQPQLYKDSTMVINPQIANQADIDGLRQALEYVVTDGLRDNLPSLPRYKWQVRQEQYNLKMEAIL